MHACGAASTRQSWRQRTTYDSSEIFNSRRLSSQQASSTSLRGDAASILWTRAGSGKR